jgi:glucan phosphoethanolaminetransferase (alkaline phosphatase superfamily)
LLTSLRKEPYRQAAVAYAAYGAVYMFGAIVQLDQERQREFFGVLPWWSFYLVGAGIMVWFPILIWKRHRTFTRVLSIFPFIKAMTLLVKQGKMLGAGEEAVTYNWFFAIVAVAASVLLMKAGFSREEQASKE